ARMRYTDSPDSWPVFWLFGDHRAQMWPGSACPVLQGEWDIMENTQPPADGFHAATHRNSGSDCGVSHELREFEAPANFKPTDWHTYGGLWSADGNLCSTGRRRCAN